MNAKPARTLGAWFLTCSVIALGGCAPAAPAPVAPAPKASAAASASAATPGNPGDGPLASLRTGVLPPVEHPGTARATAVTRFADAVRDAGPRDRSTFERRVRLVRSGSARASASTRTSRALTRSPRFPKTCRPSKVAGSGPPRSGCDGRGSSRASLSWASSTRRKSARTRDTKFRFRLNRTRAPRAIRSCSRAGRRRLPRTCARSAADPGTSSRRRASTKSGALRRRRGPWRPGAFRATTAGYLPRHGDDDRPSFGALADGVGERSQDVGQVPAGAVLDVDRGHEIWTSFEGTRSARLLSASSSPSPMPSSRTYLVNSVPSGGGMSRLTTSSDWGKLSPAWMPLAMDPARQRSAARCGPSVAPWPGVTAGAAGQPD